MCGRKKAGWRLRLTRPTIRAFVGPVSAAPPGNRTNQYSFFAQSSQSPLNGRFMFSMASMMSW